jgi:hypothetical protein
MTFVHGMQRHSGLNMMASSRSNLITNNDSRLINPRHLHHVPDAFRIYRLIHHATIIDEGLSAMPIHSLATLLDGVDASTIIVGAATLLGTVSLKAWTGGRKCTWEREWAGKMILIVVGPGG